MIHQFECHLANAKYWLDEEEARAALLGREEDTGQTLDYQGYRLGRTLWHAAANMTPLAYQPPWALLALLLIGPLALVIANLLAAWPARGGAACSTTCPA